MSVYVYKYPYLLVESISESTYMIYIYTHIYTHTETMERCRELLVDIPQVFHWLWINNFYPQAEVAPGAAPWLRVRQAHWRRRQRRETKTSRRSVTWTCKLDNGQAEKEVEARERKEDLNGTTGPQLLAHCVQQIFQCFCRSTNKQQEFILWQKQGGVKGPNRWHGSSTKLFYR